MATLAVGGGYWAAMTLAPATPELQLAPGAGTEFVVGSTAETAAANAGHASVASMAGAPESATDDQLILAVLDTLERRPNIAARLRQSVRLGDDRLTGEGAFWQQGVGNQRRTRWELKTLVVGETAVVTQIYDGEAVWTTRRLPATYSVTRIDMATLRRELESWPDAAERGRAPLGEGLPELLARGGLSQLLASLHRCFAFGPQQAVGQGDRNLLAVIGQWRPEQLDRVWPGASTTAADDWPAQLPHHVLVYIDARERFPYLVEYRGVAQTALANSSEGYAPARDPLATFEFVDVQFAAAMPADLFQFAPPDNNFTDITDRVIDELRPTAAPTADASAARRAGTWR